ncbi:fatty acyl-CoA synthetase [Sphingobium boeckii]|uniref:3-methylmercaptopropionyl-CoA ligase n=1 Tax=Sphingobium boeckii TaxID=1082345 RepID=A0A7W9AI11_9SPHN|nr:fatty acyl-CoA synthetase [Sphingobium boeckii]MBB5685948.1 fatty-acyl-CoA synthase [Sphingobium boeckii]
MIDAGEGNPGADLRQQSLSTMLRRSARRHRERVAIICGSVSWSYADLDHVADQLCNGLKSAGLIKGDRVAVMARNSHAFVALRFAVARAGGVLVPVNFMLNVDDTRYILSHSQARFLFVDAHCVAIGREAGGEAVETIYGLPGELEPVPGDVVDWNSLLGAPDLPPEVTDCDDLLQIIYTSGTEARPKGAMLTHGAVLWQYQSCVIDCEWTADTIALHALPLFHCAQLDAMLGPALQVGARNIITARPTPDNLLHLLAAHRATSFFAPATIWISLLRSPLFDRSDLSSLAKAYYGASIMPGEVLREIKERLPGLRLWNLYGQTEIAPVATILFPHEHADRPASCGRPALHVSTRVVDDAMRDVAPGDVGEVVHRSPHLMIGYWQDPERTAAAFEGGWFHSGDLATIDDQGYLTIVDRKKDMIKTGGENVSSREVEEILYVHPGVAEVAVIGLPDPQWVEAVTAFVVPRDGHAADEGELLAHCRERLSGFKAPKRIVIVQSLPRNASGKILKRELRTLI